MARLELRQWRQAEYALTLNPDHPMGQANKLKKLERALRSNMNVNRFRVFMRGPEYRRFRSVLFFQLKVHVEARALS